MSVTVLNGAFFSQYQSMFPIPVLWTLITLFVLRILTNKSFYWLNTSFCYAFEELFNKLLLLTGRKMRG